MQENETVETIAEEWQDHPVAQVQVLRSCYPSDIWKNNKPSVEPYYHFDEENNCGGQSVFSLTKYFAHHDKYIAGTVQP